MRLKINNLQTTNTKQSELGKTIMYNEIYDLFEPVFNWIQKHYPSGAFFIVDSDSAELYCGKPELLVPSKRLIPQHKEDD